MKLRKFFTFLAIVSFMAVGCSEDNNNSNNAPITGEPGDTGGGQNNPVTVSSEWIPANIQIIQIIPLETIAYPHIQGCENDYLQLMSNNTGKYYKHEEGDCTLEIIEQAFVRNGDQVTLSLNGFTVSGTIAESANQMVVTSSANEYLPFIQQMYPEAEQYLSLLQGATIKLTLNKKQ